MRRAGQRVAADEREAGRQRAGRLDNLALRAPRVRDHGRLTHVLVELFEQRDVRPDRRRQNHDVGLGKDDEIVGGDVDGVQPHRGLEDVLVVDADDQRLRPQLPRRQRD